MKRIVIGVDPAQEQQPALRWAASYAALEPVALTIVTVWHPDQAELPPDRYQEFEDQVRAHVDREMADVAHAHDEALPFEIRTEEGGKPEHVIRAAVADLDPELVVVGHHPRSLVLTEHLTSLAVALANEAPCPVVVAQGDAPELRPGPVVAAIDSLPADHGVLQFAAELAEALGSGVRAVFALDPLGESYPHPEGQTRTEQHEQRVLAEAREAVAEHIPLEVSVGEGEAEKVIAAVADEHDASLVVVGRGTGSMLDRVPTRLIHAGDRSIAVLPAR